MYQISFRIVVCYFMVLLVQCSKNRRTAADNQNNGNEKNGSSAIPGGNEENSQTNNQSTPSAADDASPGKPASSKTCPGQEVDGKCAAIRPAGNKLIFSNPELSKVATAVSVEMRFEAIVGGIYWATQFHLYENGQPKNVGYVGLQVDRAIFAFFGNGAKVSNAYGSKCSGNADGGAGANCHLFTEIQAGKTYRLTVQRSPAQPNLWLGMLDDVDTGTSTMIGSLELEASQAHFWAPMVIFEEHFWAIDDCSKYGKSKVTISNLKYDGTSIDLQKPGLTRKGACIDNTEVTTDINSVVIETGLPKP